MIKVERKLTDKAQKAIESLEEAKAKNASYNTLEVNSALREMFHGKCYICENKEITSYQIEHLIPYRGNKELKYDWNNLFLSCAHCNNIKLDKYVPIIDCTKENVEEYIAFRKKGYFGTEEELVFEKLDSRKETINTVKLLEEVYYGFTPQKKMESKILRRTLRKELSQFKEYVREYQEAEDDEKEDLKYLIKKQLEDSSPFAAFKRWLIRDNKESYSELLPYIE
ncbi:HNH endonuclease [uncultured Eubacterium sp.]|uniref:HNH endonuclease n=1 Tax=uncultured Eubacterium sp. TaxID=165185 RepID=UPI0026741C23|nr:HNH endonuclease [uncultured Eubacterium sp.]